LGQSLGDFIMNFRTFRTTAAVAALILGIAVLPHTANAQLVDNADVDVTLTTNSAIDVQHVADIDFGEWFVVVRSGETPTLTIAAAGPATAVAAGEVDSTLTELTAGTGPGQVTVEVPAATIMTMTRSGTVPFTDPGIALTAVTYATAAQNGNIDADTDDGLVTVAAGATPENVDLGAELTFSATPADDDHTASFTLTFAY